MAPPSQLSTDIFYHEDATQAWITQYATDIIGAMPPLSIADRWWAPYSYVAPSSAPILKIPFNLVIPRMSEYTGRNNLQRGVTVWHSVRRNNPKNLGFQQDLKRLQGGDFGMFAQSPAMIAHAIDIEPDLSFAAALNAGFTTDDWTGTKFFVLSGAASNLQKPINPGMQSLGKYTNARENFAFTSDNVSTLIGDLNTRKGIDGRYLGNEEREVTLWIPPTMAQEAKQIIDRLEIMFSSGTGGTARAYKLCNYKVIRDMRTDLWCATLKPSGPWELMFVHMLGANPNSEQALSGMPSWQVLQGQDMTPHRSMTVIDTAHYLFQTSQILGYKAELNETCKLLNGIAIAAAFTGSAS
jgi:hypothetical protein